MKRIMVNLDDPIGHLVEQKAAEQRRSTSSYIALIVENDLRLSGLLSATPPPAFQEFMAKAQAEAASDPALLRTLETALRRHHRRRGQPARLAS
jgi:hypothetical protein